MMLYVLIIAQHCEQFSEILQGVMELKMTPLIAKDSAQALSVLAQYPYMIHMLIAHSHLISSEPFLLSQLRMQHQHKHLPVVIWKDPQEQGLPIGSDALIMQQISDLQALLPQLEVHAKTAQRAQLDIGAIQEAQFRFQTLDQASLLAQYLARQYPSPENILVGIQELFINAVEHGNLNISYEDKSSLLACGRWLEEVHLRLNQDPYQHRWVDVVFKRTSNFLELTVSDQGEGFEWQKFETFDRSRLLASHGRGIMMAKSLSFSSVEYFDKGNKVRAILKLEPNPGE